MNLYESEQLFRQHRPRLESLGVSWDDPNSAPRAYLPPEWKAHPELAMDALPTLVTEANSSIPAIFTTFADPDVFEILFAPTRAAEILGEVRRGSWVDDAILFPVVEPTGEVSSYGDYNDNGRAGVNANWPARQSYIFQLIEEFGDREVARAGAAKINWVAETDKAAAAVMNRFTNFTYFFGVQGLQNYGLLNDPNLSAAITPATKAAGGTAWVNTSGQINATANEVYADIEALFYKLVVQTGGLVTQETKMVLVLSPPVSVAMTATNSFNVNVTDLVKKNFPNITIITAVQYGALTATNPQGVAAGNFAQLIAVEVEGQKTGFMAYNERMRAFPVVRHMSSYRKKIAGGTWGAVIRFPGGVAAMVGL